MSRKTNIPASGADTSDRAPADAVVATAAAEWFAKRDARTSDEQEAAFQRWLAADARHAAAYGRLDAAWSSFGQPVRAGCADELLRELETRARRRRRTRAQALAATLAILFVAGALWNFSSRTERTSPAQETATLLRPRQETLPDGSVVTLDNGAEIAVAFSDARRDVVLKQGEAHFQVAKNPKRPFFVLAHGVAVRAVGTAFSVHLDDAAVAVLVTEGTVAVGKSAEASAPESTPPSDELSRVTSHNRVVVETSTEAPAPRILSVDAKEVAERLAWMAPRVEFTGTPLEEAVALLNREAARHAKVKLVIGDPELGKVRVSGIFRTDNIEAFVLLLENGGFAIKTERLPQAIVLHRAP